MQNMELNIENEIIHLPESITDIVREWFEQYTPNHYVETYTHDNETGLVRTFTADRVMIGKDEFDATLAVTLFLRSSDHSHMDIDLTFNTPIAVSSDNALPIFHFINHINSAREDYCVYLNEKDCIAVHQCAFLAYHLSLSMTIRQLLNHFLSPQLKKLAIVAEEEGRIPTEMLLSDEYWENLWSVEQSSETGPF